MAPSTQPVPQSPYSALNLLPDPIAVLDSSGAIIYLNGAESQLLDIDGPALIPPASGLDYLSVFCAHLHVSATDSAELSQGLSAVLRGDSASHEQEVCCQVAGKTRWFALSVSPIPGPIPADGHAAIIGALLKKHDVSAYLAQLDELRKDMERAGLLSEMAREGVVLTEKGVIFDINASMTRMLGHTRAELVGRPAMDFCAPESRAAVKEHTLSNLTEPYEITIVRKDGTTFPALVAGQPVPYQGRMVRRASFYDLSRIREMERALQVAHAEQLRAQAEMLAELSTPLIPLTEQILVMPLIGNIDSQRAERVLETLLQGIEKSRASAVIIDITGVRTMDSHVGNTLIQAARAVRLLGATPILTGIRAEVAQLLVRLGVDLSQLVTHSRLQSGIEHARSL